MKSLRQLAFKRDKVYLAQCLEIQRPSWFSSEEGSEWWHITAREHREPKQSHLHAEQRESIWGHSCAPTPWPMDHPQPHFLNTGSCLTTWLTLLFELHCWDKMSDNSVTAGKSSRNLKQLSHHRSRAEGRRMHACSMLTAFSLIWYNSEPQTKEWRQLHSAWVFPHQLTQQGKPPQTGPQTNPI